MNNIFVAFIEEARELLEESIGCLLRLERDPEDLALVNTVFRAFHTVKGSSTLFELTPMTRVVHAGEDLLQSVRDGEAQLSSELIDLYLESLDHIREWVRSLEVDGRLPETATGTAETLVERYVKIGGGKNPRLDLETRDQVTTVEQRLTRPPWLSFGRRLPEFVGHDLVAVQYEPDAQCFFCGDDPLRFISVIPSLLHFDVYDRPLQTDEDATDPHICRLGFRAVAACSLDELRTHFAYVEDQVTFYQFSISFDGSMDAAIRLLQELTSALDVSTSAEISQSRRNAHIALANNVLQGAGFPRSWQRRFQESAKQATTDGDDAPLRDGFRSIVDFVVAAQRAAVRLSMVPELGGATELPPPTAPVVADSSTPSGPPKAAGAVEKNSTERGPGAGQQNGAGKGQSTAGQVYKIDQARIDGLLELAGELLVAKNALPYLARRAEDLCAAPQLSREIKDQASVLSRIADSLHHAVMQLRIIPITHVFDRFPRLVRDVARKLDKAVRLEVVGEHTEADKSTVERLADPLLHVVRNSLDHGLEHPDERAASGKPKEGYIRLSAEQSRGALVVRVEDDGRGIDPQRIKAVATRRGVITSAEAEALSDEEAMMLVFRAGFSTAEKVSDLSGRGVGMDVVRTAIESCGGSVELASKLSVGTTVTMTMPLSMAVTRVLLVVVEGHTFGVPFDLVLETMHVTPRQLTSVRDGKVLAVCERVVRVLVLRDMLDLESSNSTQSRVDGEDEVYLTMLLARTPRGEVGLIVDAFEEAVDVMLKPLAGPLAHLREYLGCSLLGDGRALLVLNLAELV